MGRAFLVGLLHHEGKTNESSIAEKAKSPVTPVGARSVHVSTMFLYDFYMFLSNQGLKISSFQRSYFHRLHDSRERFFWLQMCLILPSQLLAFLPTIVLRRTHRYLLKYHIPVTDLDSSDSNFCGHGLKRSLEVAMLWQSALADQQSLRRRANLWTRSPLRNFSQKPGRDDLARQSFPWGIR